MYGYLRKRYKENLLLLLIIVCSTVLKIQSAFLTATAFNGLLAGKVNVFVSSAALCGLCYLGYIILLAFKTWYEVVVKQKMLTDIRQDITSHFANYIPDKENNYTSSQLLSWLTTDIKRLDAEGFSSLYYIVEAVVDAGLSIIALFSMNWILVVAILFLAFLNLYLPTLVDNPLTARFKQLTVQQEKFVTQMTGLLDGFYHLFALNKQSYLVSKSKEVSETVKNSEVDTYKIVGVATFLAAFGNVAGQLGALVVSGLLVAKRLLTFGDVMSVTTLSAGIFNDISNLASKIISVKGIIPIFDKYQEFFDVVKELSEVEKQKSKDHLQTDDVILENLSFSFEDKTIFNHVNYQFEKGKKYCLVGDSGIGKSTLFKLLNGTLKGYQGTIKLGRQSLEDISGHDLRQLITYISQAPHSFNGTIYDNLVLDGKYSDEEIWKILTLVGLSEEVKKMPNGLNTVIGEGELSLSGGQAQRLSLARALLNGGSIILMDEGTSSLHKELAQTIEKALLEKEGYTVLMITHHLSSELKEKFDDVILVKDQQLQSLT